MVCRVKLVVVCVAVAALLSGGAIVAQAGSVYSWGDQVVRPVGKLTAIAVGGGGHRLGLLTDGSIVAWGDNDYGQCDVPSPNSGFVAIAAGEKHSLGLKSDGSIVAWGDCEYAQCAVRWPNSGYIAIAAHGYHSLGLRSDGRIEYWGYPPLGTFPTSNSDFVAIAAGPGAVVLGLKSDGNIVAWGYSSYGQCDVPEPNTGFIAADVGYSHCLGLKSDGSIVAWGDNQYGQCDVPSPNTGFVAIAAEEDYSLGLKSDGSIVAWGQNSSGQCNLPEPNAGFVAIDDRIGLRSDGSFVSWGRSQGYDIPASEGGFVQVAGGALNVGLRADGTVVDWGGYGSTVPSSSDIKAIAAGSGQRLALREDGSIVAWGWNAYGQCDVPSPNEGFVAIGAGYGHSLAVRSDGSVEAWGHYGWGQCDVPEPNAGFVAVSGGYCHSLGLRDNGSIVAWGDNGRGQCNVPSPNSGFVAIAAGYNHSLGLRSDGSVAAWGYNYYGQCDVPSPNIGFVAIAAGGEPFYSPDPSVPSVDSASSMGLRADGSVVVWGSCGYCTPQTWRPNDRFVAIAVGGNHCLAIRASDFDSLSDTKLGIDWMPEAAVPDRVVSAVFPDRFYITDPDRKCGMCITGSTTTVTEGDVVSVTGGATELDGEAAIEAQSVAVSGHTDAPAPFGMNVRSLGGSKFGIQRAVHYSPGLNNIGLLVKVCGSVAEIDPSPTPQWFTLDDGSVYIIPESGPDWIGEPVYARVRPPEGAAPPLVGSPVVVTGISSCYEDGTELRRQVLVRSAGDIASP